MIKADSVNLPESIDGWVLTGPPQMITRETIFDYMDGGGELYLAYKFVKLQVYKYVDQAENELLVEIYEMQHPDEAFGLLSLDWTGEPVVLNPENQNLPENEATPVFTALYGEGLLRARIDNLYLRILALRESTAAKETILKLGKMIAAGTSRSTLPEILKIIKTEADSGWQIRKDRTSYFHSHLILNSLYYLSHQNILHLEPDCEALYTEWIAKEAPNRKSARLIIIKYPERKKAEIALVDFLRAYLQEKSEEALGAETFEKAIKIEDGWLGWKISDNYLVLSFEAPDERSVKELFKQLATK